MLSGHGVTQKSGHVGAAGHRGIHSHPAPSLAVTFKAQGEDSSVRQGEGLTDTGGL